MESLPAGPCELECGRIGQKVAADVAWYRGGFAGIKFAAPITFDPKQLGG